MLFPSAQHRIQTAARSKVPSCRCHRSAENRDSQDLKVLSALSYLSVFRSPGFQQQPSGSRKPYILRAWNPFRSPQHPSVTVSGRRRCVCAGRNSCTGSNDFSTTKALGVAGIAVNLILVVRFTCIYGRCAAYMGVCILVVLEGVSIIAFHSTANRTGKAYTPPAVSVSLIFPQGA